MWIIKKINAACIHWTKKQPARIKAVIKQMVENSTVAPRTYWDYLGYSGTVILSLLMIQFITGVLLLIYYDPHSANAFASHVAIKNDVPYGMLFSNIHTAGAKLILLMVFIHMFRIMMTSAHRGPRAPQWYTGMALLTFMLITGFSGYLLPWSQQSYWACVIGTEAIRVIPLIGSFIVWLLRGGQDVSTATLSRFYVFHVFILPITIVVLLWYHIKGVWGTGVIASSDMHALNNPERCTGCGVCGKICPFDAVRMVDHSQKKVPAFNESKCNACRTCLKECPAQCIDLISQKGQQKHEPIFPHNFMRRTITTLIALTLFFFSVFFFHRWIIAAKTPANPLITPDRIKPDWYFLGPYQVLKVLPNEQMGLLALFSIYMIMLFLPEFDRSGPRDPGQRPVYMFLVANCIVLFTIFTLWGWVS